MFLLLVADPLVLTYHQVRQERLNRALIVAIKRNHTPAAIQFLDAGADPNARDEPIRAVSFRRGLRDWWHPTHQPSSGPTCLLLALGSNEAGIPDANDFPGVDLPARKTPPENLPVVKALLAHGADPNVTSEEGTPLILSALWGYFATTQLLLNAHANVNATSSQGMTPLMVVGGDEPTRAALTKLLLDRGAGINALDANGATALMHAIDEEDVEVVRALLTHKAAANIYRGELQSAYDSANREDSDDQMDEILLLLKQAAAKP